MLEMYLDADTESWNRENIGSTDDCFLVFVGGNYIDMLDQVAEKVESIGKKLQSMAKAIFINSQEGERRNIRETWPPLVNTGWWKPIKKKCNIFGKKGEGAEPNVKILHYVIFFYNWGRDFWYH